MSKLQTESVYGAKCDQKCDNITRNHIVTYLIQVFISHLEVTKQLDLNYCAQQNQWAEQDID